MRILILNEDSPSRALVRVMLESMGHEVDESTNTCDALAMVAEDPEISMVLLDLELLAKNTASPQGACFLQSIKAVNGLLKVVVVGSNADHLIAKALVEFGAFDCLLKPLTQDAIANTIYKASVFIQGEQELRSVAKLPMFLVVDASQQSSIKLLRETATENLLRQVLTNTGHNVSAAARQLNISREHLYYYLKKHRILRPND